LVSYLLEEMGNGQGEWKLKMASVAYWDGNCVLFHLKK